MRQQLPHPQGSSMNTVHIRVAYYNTDMGLFSTYAYIMRKPSNIVFTNKFVQRFKDTKSAHMNGFGLTVFSLFFFHIKH